MSVTIVLQSKNNSYTCKLQLWKIHKTTPAFNRLDKVAKQHHTDYDKSMKLQDK